MKSPNFVCRWLGCQNQRPETGLLLTHCWRCGMRTSFAAFFNPEYWALMQILK